ncbi:MAG: hypothetical protein SPK91_02665 [Bacteroidales bacterium]|nr:hypothetical protein [Bacteroidales bacterium]
MNKFEELKNAQDALHEEIQRLAEEKGFVSEDVCPIYDGVGDIDAYLQSKLKIMWILKEPYDDFDDNNKPIGGGWTMYEGGLSHPDAWKQKSYQGMTYVLYGFRHDLYWADLPAIRNNKSMITELNNMAYINISKMPGQKQTSHQAVILYYNIWKDLLYKQITTYNPDVIIFGGNFSIFEQDLPNDQLEQMERIGTDGVFCDIYKYKNRWLLSANHPARFSEVFVDGLIDSLKYVNDHMNMA